MTLPGWLEPLPDAAQQRAIDEWAIEQRGIPGLELMEHAGSGLAELLAERLPAGRVAVVCGKGNNGGDGLVVARLLREQGREVSVMLTGSADQLRGDAKTNLERLPGPAPEQFSATALEGAAGIVDAILGTGFSGQPHDPAASAIDAINAIAGPGGALVFACDVPSGVDGSTGEVAGAAVKADLTVTFHAGKPGLWISPGKAHAGEVTVIDIGIPSGGAAAAEIGLIDDAVVAGLPQRGAESTKFAAGSVLVCGGSIGLTGAPCMAAEAAMRAGAGYVTVCVPASLNLIFEARLLEVMTVPIADADGRFDERATDPVLERTERAQSLVLGPGLGRDRETLSFARHVARRGEVPLLLDADGLNAHAGSLGSLADRTAPTVLTPHAGELARLLEGDSASVSARRLQCARAAADRSGAVVVLKGDDTLVAEPRGRVGVSRGGAAALATAGTGDVLSGVIGALLAKRMEPFHAACAGVLIHARAGQIAGRRIGAEGVIARDVIEALPGALADALAAGAGRQGLG